MNCVLQDKLTLRISSDNFRKLPQEPLEDYTDFASNDYLGLSRSEQLFKKCLKEVFNRKPSINGSTGSRLLTGNSAYAEDLENFLAKFHGYESGVLFGCGYMANIGLASALSSPHHVFLFDTQSHASTREGIRASKTYSLPFRHNDPEHLESRLKKIHNKTTYIYIESVYSTDGSMAPIEEICKLAQTYQARIIIDEAHSVGIFGKSGEGLIAEKQLQPNIFGQITTFGKGPGAYGAVILGSELLKNTLVNFCTPYIYTTALPFYNLALIRSAYQILAQSDDERKSLRSNIEFFKMLFTTSSDTHIQPLEFPGTTRVKALSQKLLDKDHIRLLPLTSPTVKKNKELLRVCLHSYNTKEEIQRLYQLLQQE